MTKGLGCVISASASCNFCFARMCAGIGGTSGTCARLFRQLRQMRYAMIARSSTPSVHQTHAQGLGISTGGLMSRMSFALVATRDAVWFVAMI